MNRMLFALLLVFSSAFGRIIPRPNNLQSRDPCTVNAQGYEALDDTPLINDAIKACGDGGTIILPENQAYSIHSPIDFSPCRSCEVQIEGQLYLSRNYEFWARSESVFTLSDVHGVTITSKTGKGLIDGQAINYYLSFQGSAYGIKYWKFLTHITNRSSDVTISGLTIRNPLHGFFLTRGNSSGIRFSNLKLNMEQQWGREPYNEGETFGFQIGQSSDVSINDIDISFSHRKLAEADSPVGVCAAVDIGASNVQISNVFCRGAWGGALIQVGSVTPAIIGPGLSNIVFKNWTVDPGYAATGFKNMHYANGLREDKHGPFNGAQITNVTWDGFTIKNGPPVVADFCYLRMRNNSPFSAYCPANVEVKVERVQMKNFNIEKDHQIPTAGWGNINSLSRVTIDFQNWHKL